MKKTKTNNKQQNKQNKSTTYTRKLKPRTKQKGIVPKFITPKTNIIYSNKSKIQAQKLIVKPKKGGGGGPSSKKETNEFIPKYDVKFGPAFATLHLNLNKDQSVYAEGGVYNRMDDSVEMKTSSRGGIFQGITRALLTSTTMFLNTFKGLSSIGNTLVLSSHLPGDILALKVNKGQSIVMTNNAFLSATDNIEPPSTRFRGKNLFLGDNMFLTEIKLTDRYHKDGMVWVSSYGPYKKITLKKDEIHLVDGGLFLCADGDVRFDVVKPSSKQGYIKSVVLSGEGFSMMFEGPCEFYVSGRNEGSLINYIKKHSYKAQEDKRGHAFRF